MGGAERRRQLLAQYFFECRCQACLEELQDGDAPSPSLFHCPACQGPLQGRVTLRCAREDCNRLVPEEDLRARLLHLQRLAQAASEFLEGGQPGRALALLQEGQQEAEDFLSPRHLRRGEIEDRLAQLYAATGRWAEAAGHLRRSLQAVEDHFGPTSAEAGQELFKLAQVLFNGRLVPEALQAVRRAEGILWLHLATESDQLQELREMGACLEGLPRDASAAKAP